MKNKDKTLNLFLSFFSIIVSFIIVIFANCLSVKDGKFSITGVAEKFSDPLFWIITVACSLSLIMAYFAFYNLKRSKNLESEEFTGKIKTYNERLKLKPSNFNEFIRENNLEEKTRVYKEKISDKIGKLENKYMNIPNEKLDRKRALKISKKIEELKSKITEEFISLHILHLKVKYSELHAKNFRKDAYDSIEDERKDFSNEKSILARKGISKVMSNIMTTLVFNTLILSCALYLSFSAQFFLIILTTIFSMAMNAFLGINLADRIFRKEIIIPIENKIIILEESVRWSTGEKTKTFREIIQTFIDEKNTEINKEGESQCQSQEQ